MIRFPQKPILVIIASLFLQACVFVYVPDIYPRKTELGEVEVQEPEGWFVGDKVLIVDISGFLTSVDSGGLFGRSENMIDVIKEVLRKAEEDRFIKAVILRIDTPGGDVTTSNILYKEIKDFKERSGKAVIAEMMGMATSGGYYVAMAADRVYAHPTTITGNIGVVSIFPRLEGLASKIGVDVRVIKSADKKDMGSMWRQFSPEEREIFQSLINDYYQQFLDVISENRKGLNREEIRRLADGRVYTARQALHAGLIDGIAYLPEAIKFARQQAGIQDSSVVMYKRAREYKENIYSLSPYIPPQTKMKTQIGLFNLDTSGLLFQTGPRFLYLWMP